MGHGHPGHLLPLVAPQKLGHETDPGIHHQVQTERMSIEPLSRILLRKDIIDDQVSRRLVELRRVHAPCQASHPVRGFRSMAASVEKTPDAPERVSKRHARDDKIGQPEHRLPPPAGKQDHGQRSAEKSAVVDEPPAVDSHHFKEVSRVFAPICQDVRQAGAKASADHDP